MHLCVIVTGVLMRESSRTIGVITPVSAGTVMVCSAQIKNVKRALTVSLVSRTLVKVRVVKVGVVVPAGTEAENNASASFACSY